jgi:hypothetical protein
MIKLNQPAQLALTVSNMDGATGATVKYRTPTGTEGEWTTGVAIDAGEGTVTYDIPADTLNETGKWLFVPVVTIAGGNTYPGSAHAEFVHNTYS